MTDPHSNPDAAPESGGGTPGEPSGGSGGSASAYQPDAGMTKDNNEEQPRIVIRDKRRIDPETGQVRNVPQETSATEVSPPTPTEEQLADIDRLTGQLAERTSDLQRVTAEYANYRRRVDRDRQLLGEIAQDKVLLDLIPVLDDLDLADSHGDLTGGFKTIADGLMTALSKSGLEAFGVVGDEFDPKLHEAVAHSTSPEVSGPTCVAIMRRGYRRGERVLRPAMVAVADPEQ